MIKPKLTQAEARWHQAECEWNRIREHVLEHVWFAHHRLLYRAVVDKCRAKILASDFNPKILEDLTITGRVSNSWNNTYVTLPVTFCIPALEPYCSVREPETTNILSNWADFPIEPWDTSFDEMLAAANLELPLIKPYSDNFQLLRRLIEHARPLTPLFPDLRLARFTSPVPRPDPFPTIPNLLSILTTYQSIQGAK